MIKGGVDFNIKKKMYGKEEMKDMIIYKLFLQFTAIIIKY